MSGGVNGEMSCPRCGLLQPAGDECARCGVVFRKIASAGATRRRRPSPAPPPGAPPPGVSVGALASWLAVIAALALAVWAWPRGEAGGPDPRIQPEPLDAAAAGLTPSAAVAVHPRPPAPQVAATEPSPAADGPPLVPIAVGAELPASLGSPVHGSPVHEAGPAGDGSPDAKLVPVRLPTSWYEGASGYRDAVAEARDDHRVMAVYFRTDWCPYCRRLESQLLSSGPVIETLRSVVKVRINPEAGAAERELGTRYGVTGYPSLFIQQSAASPPVRVPAYTHEDDGWRLLSPEEFVALLHRLVGA